MGGAPAWRTPALWAAIFLALWLAFGWVALQLPTLPDTDSYYHLGVARLYAEEGIVERLDWTRFSLLGDGFGDKELLFHWALMPFSGTSPAPAPGEAADTTGGRWALAFWNALAATCLVAAARRAGASWSVSWLVPALLWIGSLDFLGRLIRLRPETAALVLFVVAALCAGARRHRTLGLMVFVFTLTYTAFHALLGLCLLWFLWQAWNDPERLPWQGLAYPLVGAGLALIVHPHFPHNLVLWKVQSVDFFRLKGALDVGTEIGAQATDEMLLQNLPWLLGCAVLALACFGPGAKRTGEEKATTTGPTLRDTADALTIAAACFAVLYLLMMRFSTHALPLLTLALLFRLAAAGRRPGSALRLPGGLRLPTAAALAVILLFGAWRSAALLHGMATAGEREHEWRSFAAAVPEGARVVAPWGQTPIYLFFAPWAAYLNALDPVFMAVPHPERYRLQRSLWDGDEPDVPVAAVVGLDSDHLAVSRFLADPKLVARLTGDPRVRTVYAGWTLLFAFRPPPPDHFVTDWRWVPEGTTLPPSTGAAAKAGAEIESWPAYEPPDDPGARALDAYVDGRRLGLEGRCFAVTTSRELASASRWELAPAGPTTLWVQSERAQTSTQTIRIQDSPGAVLGRGVQFATPSKDGPVRFTVLTCAPEGSEQGIAAAGFYLRRLGSAG